MFISSNRHPKRKARAKRAKAVQESDGAPLLRRALYLTSLVDSGKHLHDLRRIAADDLDMKRHKPDAERVQRLCPWLA